MPGPSRETLTSTRKETRLKFYKAMALLTLPYESENLTLTYSSGRSEISHGRVYTL